MDTSRQQLGASGEELAAQLLLKRGYCLLARNLRLRLGEIDLLFLDGQTLVLVEVKTKISRRFGRPAEMITAHKRLKLRQLALVAASTYNKVDYRIDVVAIDWSSSLPNIEHFINIA